MSHKTLPAFALPASPPARRGVRMRCWGAAAAEAAAAEARAAPGSLPRGWDGSSWSENSPAPRGPAGVRAGGPGEGARTARGERGAQLGTVVAPGTCDTKSHSCRPTERGCSAPSLFLAAVWGFARGKRSGPQKLGFSPPPPLSPLLVAAARVEFNVVSQAVPGWLCRSAS